MRKRRRSPDRSDKRDRILEAIQELMRENQRPPTIRELQRQTGFSSTSVIIYNLRALAAAGKLRLADNISTRSLQLLLGPDDPCPYCGAPPCTRP